MSQRNYPNFLNAYLQLHMDQFVPAKFHYWAGVSIVAAVLERKVWLPWSQTVTYYPNIYTLLVGRPAIGKSTAVDPAMEFIRDMNVNGGGDMKFIPAQITEAMLLEIMSGNKKFQYRGKEMSHSSGYYCTSEANADLKDIYGDFVATITALYDCRKYWDKATKKDGFITVQNGCFNLLAACTFDYLGKVLGENKNGISTIHGGFASRLMYITQKDVFIRQSPWQNRGILKSNAIDRNKLLEDLRSIHKLVGEFRGEAWFQDNWETCFIATDERRQKLPSEKLQALLARRSPNIMKLCMILSAAESDDLILKKHHWEMADSMLNEMESNLPALLRESKSKDVETKQGLLSSVFSALLKNNRRMRFNSLRRQVLVEGHNLRDLSAIIETFTEDNDMLKIHHSDNGMTLELIGNPDNYI